MRWSEDVESARGRLLQSARAMVEGEARPPVSDALLTRLNEDLFRDARILVEILAAEEALASDQEPEQGRVQSRDEGGRLILGYRVWWEIFMYKGFVDYFCEGPWGAMLEAARHVRESYCAHKMVPISLSVFPIYPGWELGDQMSTPFPTKEENR